MHQPSNNSLCNIIFAFNQNQLKMWVTFLIPKIEDGNNFGVSIQEDTLGEIRAVEGEAATFYDAIARYHINRGKIISKVSQLSLSSSCLVIIQKDKIRRKINSMNYSFFDCRWPSILTSVTTDVSQLSSMKRNS